MKLLHSILPKLLGTNLNSTPKDVIIDQLNEPRPLPMGVTDFHEWSDRIISGALIPMEDITGMDSAEKKQIFIEGQKYALANMILHLGPTESHKPDAHFIHTLRKVAVNQVVHSVAQDIKKTSDARIAAKKALEEPKEEHEGSC